jgi:hypothetical protein
MTVSIGRTEAKRKKKKKKGNGMNNCRSKLVKRKIKCARQTSELTVQDGGWLRQGSALPVTEWRERERGVVSQSFKIGITGSLPVKARIM